MSTQAISKISALKLPVSVTDGSIDAVCPLMALFWRGWKCWTPETSQSYILENSPSKKPWNVALEDVRMTLTQVKNILLF
jgi:hypothetical protein